LQFCLGYFAFGLSNRSLELTSFAFEPGAVSLESRQTSDLHKVVFPKLAHALKFFADKRDLSGFRVLLRGKSLNFILQLGDALFQLRLLAERGRATKLKQLAFIGDGDGDGALVGTGEQFGRKLDGLGAVAFGFEPRFTRGELIESFGNNSEV